MNKRLLNLVLAVALSCEYTLNVAAVTNINEDEKGQQAILNSMRNVVDASHSDFKKIDSRFFAENTNVSKIFHYVQGVLKYSISADGNISIYDGNNFRTTIKPNDSGDGFTYTNFVFDSVQSNRKI